MKEIDELILRDDLRYTTDHEWAKGDGDTIRVGITDYAQDQLGDIVFVEMPETGATVTKGEEFGTLESVKAVAEMYSPVSGEVIAVNGALEDAPDLVNTSPYDDGWIMEVKPDNAGELDDLMDRAAYLDMVKGLKS